MRAIPPFDAPVQVRRGMVLLIVITLLTLFAVTGLSFVFYAEAERTSSRNFMEAASNYPSDVDPEAALSFFLGKLIYGDTNDAAGVQNAMRGHDLAGSLYGHNYTTNAAGTILLNSTTIPFNGTGRLHFKQAGILGGAQDDYNLVNYRYFQTDGFVRDPGYLIPRASPAAAFAATNLYTGGFNAPWTYPDLNNFYLGAAMANGTILTPSFHREYLFGRLDNQANPNWSNAQGKYLTLRPRPLDNYIDPTTGQPLFPYPEGRFGDVQNLPWGTQPDSVWTDIGSPVMIAPDGRKFKMLAATFIIDLDGRINLNVAGNIKGAGTTFAGNQGWGRWEQNVSKVLTSGTEWTKLFRGTNQPVWQGRYVRNAAGPGGVAPTAPVGANLFYDLFDFDGNGAALTLPTGTTSVFPTYPNTYLNGTGTELTNHPAKYNYFTPLGGDRVLPISGMEALLRYGDKGSPALTSDLFTGLPQNFSNARTRQLVTLRSFDLATPGQVPWLTATTGVTSGNIAGYSYNYNPANPTLSSLTGTPIPFPKVSQRTTPPGGDFNPNNWQAILTTLSRLDLNRSLPNYPAPNAAGAIPNTSTAQFNQAQAARQQFARDIYNLLIKATGAVDPNTTATVVNPSPQFRAARWLAQLAVNIVDYIDNDDYMTPFIWWVSPTPAATNEILFGTELPRLVLNEAYAQYDNDGADQGLTGIGAAAIKKAQHYQLNVWVELHNPFRTVTDQNRNLGQAVLQTATQSVYKVVLIAGTPVTITKATWAGNTVTVTTSVAHNFTAGQLVTLAGMTPAGYNGSFTIASVPTATTFTYALGANPGAATAFGTATQAPNLRDPANLRGDPDPNTTTPLNNASMTALGANLWGTTATTQTVLPATGAVQDATKTNKGFYVLGPQATWLPTTLVGGGGAPDRNPHLPVTLASPAMSVQYALTAPPPTTGAATPTVLLRRLACPHMPATSATGTNPYITVDYIENLPVNENRSFTPTKLAALPPAPTTFSAFGRIQPYAGYGLPYTGLYANTTTQRAPQTTRPAANQPFNTFYARNASTTPALTNPFEWLVHLDRQLISPMELLHVSGYRPHELTQQFKTINVANQFSHYAPWFDQTSRLYRFFEFAGTHDYFSGTSMATRKPGMININTVWDVEILKAALGTVSAADDAAVQTIFNNLIANRTPGLTTTGIGPTDGDRPTGVDDKPFRSLATGVTAALPVSATGGQYPVPTGINNTILLPINGSTNAQAQTIFDPTPGGHPYLRHKWLTKAFNNLTTRSNVFAVFVTVGFFEVKDDTTTPVKLGAEIGRADNKHIRHRMFAIVDRSDMRLTLVNPASTQQAVGLAMKTGVTVPAGQTVAVTETLPAGWTLSLATATGAQLPLQLGTTIVYDPDTINEEIVTVTAVNPAANPPTFTVNMRQSHVAGTPFVFRGNPGPWPRYSARLDRRVVPYFSIID